MVETISSLISLRYETIPVSSYPLSLPRIRARLGVLY
nr:MAG TPA: hypothetical protein [Caudoviricetes sp.]